MTPAEKVLKPVIHRALSSEKPLTQFLKNQLNIDTWAHQRIIATKVKVGAPDYTGARVEGEGNQGNEQKDMKFVQQSKAG